MFRRRTLLVAFVAFALIAAGCSKRDSESAEGRQEAQSGTTSVSDVLDNFKTEIDNGLLTDSMKAVFPNLELPSESSDAINKLNNELADLAKTDPKKAACAGISVLEGIVAGVTKATTELSSEAQAVVIETLKPIETSLDELMQQDQYKSNCAVTNDASQLPNQSTLIAQLLEPIVGSWDTETLICTVLFALIILLLGIAFVAFIVALLMLVSVVLAPLGVLLINLLVVSALIVFLTLGNIYSKMGCKFPSNAVASKIPVFDTEKLLELAKKAMP